MVQDQVRRSDNPATRSNGQHHHHHHRSRHDRHQTRSHRNYYHSSDESAANSSRPYNLEINQRHESIKSDPLAICYSYLIAILSSILVVLGIYLSLTRFNARFLYISLGGILLECLSACIYCMSNIRQSRRAHHKQQSRDLFTLNNSNNLVHSSPRQATSRQQSARAAPFSSMPNGESLNSTAITSTTARSAESQQLNGQLRSQQQQVSIDNRDFGEIEEGNEASPHGSANLRIQNGGQTTGSNSLDSGSNAPLNPRPSTPSLHQTPDSLSIQDKTIGHDEGRQEDRRERFANTVTTEQANRSELMTLQSNDTSQAVQHDLPDSSNQPTSQQLAIPSHNNNYSSEVGDNTQLAPTSTTNSLPETHPNAGENSRALPMSSDIEQSQTDDLIPPTTSNDGVVGAAEGNNAQSNDQQVASPSQPVRRRMSALASGRNRRQVNTRRTLVMGLSGEEEVIEINEADLDDMSVLPPPYESIATPPPVGDSRTTTTSAVVENSTQQSEPPTDQQ